MEGLAALLGMCAAGPLEAPTVPPASQPSDEFGRVGPSELPPLGKVKGETPCGGREAVAVGVRRGGLVDCVP